MNELTISLNIAEILALGGVIWGLARMSRSLDYLSDSTGKLSERMEFYGATLNQLLGRVLVLEDRSKR
jgi:hypothetical protein